MKIKIVVVDFEVPPRAKRWALRLGIPLVILGVAGIALAVPALKQWKTGDTLTADDLNNSFQAVSVPPGTIVAWGGAADTASVPAGWLLCDGSAVARTTYANLFAAIGINFGGGDGIATFNLPDLRGRFLRGRDNGAGRDPDAKTRTASNSGGLAGDSVGTLEVDSFRSHDHGGNTAGVTGNIASDRFFDYNANGCGQTGRGIALLDQVGLAGGINCFANSFSAHTHGISAAGGAETRPINVAVNYLIKQ